MQGGIGDQRKKNLMKAVYYLFIANQNDISKMILLNDYILWRTLFGILKMDTILKYEIELENRDLNDSYSLPLIGILFFHFLFIYFLFIFLFIYFLYSFYIIIKNFYIKVSQITYDYWCLSLLY